MEKFKQEFEEARNRLDHKFQEIKYSAEYLDFKKHMGDMADHSKQIFQKDMTGAGKNVGKMIKKFLSNEKFTQLINSKE